MTSTLTCGFECGQFSAGHPTSSNGSPAFNTSIVRSGTRSMRCDATSARTTVTIAIGTINPCVGRVYVYFGTLPASDTDIVGAPASVWQIAYKTADQKLYCWNTNAGYGASGVSVTTGRWYRLDWSTTTTAMLAAVEGQALGGITDTGVNTTGVSLGGSSGDMYFDDFIGSQTSADYPIGPGYVNHFVPTSDGTHNIAGTGDFQRGNTGTDILNATTTAWQLIDDVPLPSGAVDEADNQRAVAPVNATDYPECVFGPASGISTPTFAPRAVEVILAHHQIGTGAGSFDVQLNDNGTTDNIISVVGAAGVTTYRYARKHYATPPTGGAWKVTSGAGNFNNLRSRFRCGDANPDACLDAIMIEAEFPEYKPRPPLHIQQAVNRASTY